VHEELQLEQLFLWSIAWERGDYGAVIGRPLADPLRDVLSQSFSVLMIRSFPRHLYYSLRNAQHGLERG
jgi:hypothetical protein